MRRLLLVVMLTCAFALPAAAAPGERFLFVSVIQNPPVLTSRSAIKDLVVYAKAAGIKTLFVQVLYSNRAWFPSKTVSDADYQDCKKSVGEDPLALLIKEAHQQGIEVHAWLNLMSMGSNAKAAFLQKYGPSILTRNLKDKVSLSDYKIDSQYFLEPGDPRVRQELTKVVREVVRAYPALDGIQFDYIRYPDPQPHYGYTAINMARFKKATGLKTIVDESEVWKDWKRNQVTELLAGLVHTARALHPHIKVSTTGCMPFARAYYEAFQDWPAWVSTGLIDFVTIMDYSPEPEQFKRWIVAIKDRTNGLAKINISVGAYKLVHKPEIFAEEFRICEDMGTGCAIFHYGDLLQNPALKEFASRP